MAFKKGQSGNPGGRPKKLLPDGRSLVDLAKCHTETAVNALANILMSPTAPEAARISAATALLDRGWGRPSQSMELSGKVDGDFTISKIELVAGDGNSAG